MPNTTSIDISRTPKVESTAEMDLSALWTETREEPERVLKCGRVGGISEVQSSRFSVPEEQAEACTLNTIKALAWNIERGNVFEGIVDALKNHVGLLDKDVLLLTELDHGMARSGNRFVAQEIARELKMNYAFALFTLLAERKRR